MKGGAECEMQCVGLAAVAVCRKPRCSAALRPTCRTDIAVEPHHRTSPGLRCTRSAACMTVLLSLCSGPAHMNGLR